MTLLRQHLLSTGQFVFDLQLQSFSFLSDFFMSFLLCEFIRAITFGVQQYDIFIQFMLVILWQMLSLLKYLSVNFRKSLPILVCTDLQKGVVINAFLFLFLLRFVLLNYLQVKLFLKLLLFNAFWYKPLMLLKASSFLDNLLSLFQSFLVYCYVYFQDS